MMVQKCPISFRLNLLEIADVCVNVSRISMAAVLLGFTDEEQSETLKKVRIVRGRLRWTMVSIFYHLFTVRLHLQLIATVPVPNLHEQIRELEEFGLASTITKAVCRELQSLPSDTSAPSAEKKWRSN